MPNPALQNLLDRLIQFWKSEGITVPPGVELADIQAFESKHNVVLPADLRAYFERVNGSGDDLDDWMNRFWPISEVKPVGDELSSRSPERWSYPNCFVFADHSISVFCWAVRLGPDYQETSGPVFEVSDNYSAGHQVAATFTEFIEKYLADRASVF